MPLNEILMNSEISDERNLSLDFLNAEYLDIFF